MKNKTILSYLLGLSAVMALGHMSANFSTKTTPVYAEEQESFIYSEDFSNDENESAWNSALDFEDGKGVWTATSTWCEAPIPAEKLVSSNNYVIEFDIEKKDSGDLYFHLVDLDGRVANNNIYLAFIANGQYLRLATYNDEGDVYNNSGEDQGCYDISIVQKLQNGGVHMKFVLFGDVLDCYADGKKFISTELSKFGNNRYNKGRSNVTKVTLRTIAWDFRGAAGNLVLDNITVKEALAESTDYVCNDKITSGSFIAPLGAQNLYQPNYRASATFEVHQNLVTNGEIHGYPKLQLCAIHPTTVSADPTNNIILQTYLDREFATPWTGMKKSNWDWAGIGYDGYTKGVYENVLHTFEVEVYGDNIKTKFTSNASDSAVLENTTTFTELGVTDRSAVYSLRIENEYTNCVHLEYHGHAETGAIEASVDKTSIALGGSVNASAFIFGDAKGWSENVWYVDGQATAVSELTYQHTFDTEGNHTLSYGNADHMSNVVTVYVGNKLTISADKTAIFTSESANFTVAKQGSFTGEVAWFVNGTQEGTGETFELTGVEFGTSYVVKAVCDGIESNQITVTVKASEITLSSAKGSYLTSETAEITAELKGIDPTSEIEWRVDDVVVAGQTGATLQLPLSSYEGGEEITVVAKVGNVTSKGLVISIVYDVNQKVHGDANCKTIYEQVLTEESDSAFGAYTLVQNDKGLYYQPNNYTTGNDATFPSFNVQSFQWAMDYDFLVPETINGNDEFYIYPQLMGIDTKNPNDAVELAIAVNATKLRTYVKFHNRGLILEESEYGTGANLAYGEGVTTKGWNHCTVAVDGNYFAFYINGTMTFFANVPNTTVPSGAFMSMWFSNNPYNTQAGFKDFKISAIVTPPPAVSGVSISASKVTCDVNESITLTVNPTPYNAVPETIEWYVNGAKVEGANAATFVFTPSEAGTYEIVCKMDGVSSSAKVITVKGATTPDTPSKGGCGGSIAGFSLMSLISVGAIILLKKKKEN